MKLTLTSIRDRQIASYSAPSSSLTTGQALRSFSDEVNRQAENNQLNTHSEDFELFLVGYFDTDTGLFEQTNPPSSIGVASNLKINGSNAG